MKQLFLTILFIWAAIDYLAYASLRDVDKYWENNAEYNSEAVDKMRTTSSWAHVKLITIVNFGYFALPLTGRCSNGERITQIIVNGELRDVHSTQADYFKCDRFQRFINYTN